MTSSEPTPTETSRARKISPNVTPVSCIIGAGISGTIGTFIGFLSLSIIQTFANKPLATKNAIALQIGAAVRTLVMGMGLLATGIFALATVGLLALAVQLLFRQRNL
ncbi:DUF3082 domain-containing protein [Roseofilum casamattae]|uniref:DUF3082 domain-containing protein n=1 Tax=Roseofilum casamattae BLCC-M143 TaxID=3022442 RepID=A0ABT7C013_9CYAN|nr:DUF3082 domain-containing protein [Roseofilum casamattae]MDJ1184803.1 DUF3082 domain-containing protein [Roseofilum casamattae BLCC-M143]